MSRHAPGSRDSLDDPLAAGPRHDASRRDPRRVVVLIALGAVVASTGATAGLFASMQRTRVSAQRLIRSIEPPSDHLLAAERASVAGQAALAAAVSATGNERTRLLSDAIVHSQVISVEWTKYQASAVGLPGEKDVAARYVVDQARAQATSSAVLVPIINATLPGTLPRAELDTNDAVINDLVELHTMYRTEATAAHLTLEQQAARSEQLLIAGAVVLLVTVMISTMFGLRSARRAVRDRSERRSAALLAEFETRLRRALELIQSDGSAFAVGDRAIREMHPECDTSLLVADSSRARLTPVGEAPVCGVSTPEECPAMRGGSTISFSDSTALDACPTLAAHTTRRCSATCVPIAIAGRGAAVLHLAGAPGRPPDSQGATDLVARGVGDRVTMLQALATFQLQAARDPLTGLLNRRSLEAAVEPVIAAERRYAVAFGDLDHFKRLNDLHGHEAGDRALRAFARTLRDSLRPEDITCRWGGEEFVIVMPECDAAAGAEAMDRVRMRMALGSLAGQTTAVTASFGVADSSDGSSFDEIVERADGALREAKGAGRDQVVRYDAGFAGHTDGVEIDEGVSLQRG